MHTLVPIGGTDGISTGFTLGGVIGQTLGEQIGLRSIELLHSALTWPLTHLQEQLAWAWFGIKLKNTRTKREKVKKDIDLYTYK